MERNGVLKERIYSKSLPRMILVRHSFPLPSSRMSGLTSDGCMTNSYDPGVEHLFETLITAIISKKERIERENELKRRDSIFLSSPSWSAQADEEEAREKAQQAAANSWSCCAT